MQSFLGELHLSDTCLRFDMRDYFFRILLLVQENSLGCIYLDPGLIPMDLDWVIIMENPLLRDVSHGHGLRVKRTFLPTGWSFDLLCSIKEALPFGLWMNFHCNLY